MAAKFDPTTQEYVEIIYEIQKQQQVARVKDIAERRGVTKSSVSTALAQLKQKDLIHHEAYGLIVLTESGEKLARDLESSHQLIREFFVDILQVDPAIAEENACIVEHHITHDVLKSLADFVSFMKGQPGLLAQWKNV